MRRSGPGSAADPMAILRPTNRRLVTALDAALKRVEPLVQGGEEGAVLAAARTMVRELIRRSDPGFYLEHIEDGRRLLSRIASSLGSEIRGARALAINRALGEGQPTDPSCVDFDVLGERIASLQECFQGLIEHDEGAWARQARAEVASIMAWENQFHQHQAAPACAAAPADLVPGDPVPPWPQITAETLQRYLEEKWSDRNARLAGFHPVAGGFQKLTILFDLADDTGRTEQLVLRGEQQDRFVRTHLGAIEDEFEVLTILRDLGLPVPEPVWLEDDSSRLGRVFMVSRKVPGRVVGTAVDLHGPLPEPVMRSFVTTLARINTAPWRQYETRIARSKLGYWLQFDRLADTTIAMVKFSRSRSIYPQNASPIAQETYRWLLDNVPDYDEELCLLHADYGTHNILVDDSGVTAVLDWETVRLGDAAEDLAYFLHSTRAHVDREKALAWYEDASGIKMGAYRLAYWDVFNVYKVMIGVTAARAIFSASDRARGEWYTLASWIDGAMKSAPRLLEAAEKARRSRSLRR